MIPHQRKYGTECQSSVHKERQILENLTGNPLLKDIRKNIGLAGFCHNLIPAKGHSIWRIKELLHEPAISGMRHEIAKNRCTEIDEPFPDRSLRVVPFKDNIQEF